MKILMTGSTASQVPNRRTENTLTFTRLLHQVLVSGKHDVTWINSSVSLSQEYLSEFDSVVVGIAPPTSTAAHRIYGALSVISYAKEIGNLVLVVDAPEPKRLRTGIKAIHDNPESLAKEFYSKRQEYRKIFDEDVLLRLVTSINYLYEEEWPTTLFPSFPWMSFPSLSTYIPNVGAGNAVGVNLDSFILSSGSKDRAPYSSYEDYWVVDAPNTKWSRSIENTLSYPLISARETRWEGDADIDARISRSIGSLISIYAQGNPWWSVVLAKSLDRYIPVATDWKLSSMLGSEWSVLPSSIEDLSNAERIDLANSQKISYLNVVPSRKNSIELVTNALSRK